MARYPPLASPVAREWRAYYRELHKAFHGGEVDPTVQRPEDPLVPYRDAHPRRRKKPISLRLDDVLLEVAKEVARQHGLRYQVVLRLWIQEGVRRAIHEGREDHDPCPLVPGT